MAKCQIGVFITFGTAPFDVSSNISASSGHRRMRIPPFEPARRDESNGGIRILPRPLDAELIDKISLNRCFSTVPFDVSSNISTSSSHRKMGIPTFEPACRDESNGGRFISLRPLDAKLIGEMSSNRRFYHFRYCAI